MSRSSPGSRRSSGKIQNIQGRAVERVEGPLHRLIHKVERRRQLGEGLALAEALEEAGHELRVFGHAVDLARAII